MGACAGDVDNDGRVDLYVTSYGANALYRNDGDGVFTDVTRDAGVGLSRWSTSCAFLDMDRDGDLDLFVANYLDAPKTNNRFCGDPQRRIRVYCHPLNYKGLPSVLYRNNGKGVFTDVSAAAGIAPHVGNGLGVAVGDYDDDGLPDVFVANDAVPNFLFHNEGGGRFTEVGLAAGVAVARDGKPRAGMGTEFADFNGDGRLDLVVTNHEFETHSLFRNDGGGIFTDATVESGLGPATLPFVGFGVAFFDFDNSGSSGSGDRQRPRHRQHGAVPARLDARAAKAAVPQPERPARAGDRPPGGLRVCGGRRRAHARHGRRGQRRRPRPAGDQQRRGARAAAERERAAATPSWCAWWARPATGMPWGPG